MLRAATTGAFDFAQFDPWNKRGWTHLAWVLQELERQATQEALLAQQRHHLSLLSNSRMTDESWEATKETAGDILNRLLKSAYPWLADKIGEAGQKQARQQAVETYHDLFGKPGEPRYEHMVAELSAYFKRGKLSHWEKELERAKRRRQRAA